MLIKKNRIVCILISITHVLLLVYATKYVCEFFSDIQGFNKLQEFSVIKIVPYFLIAIFPSFFLPIKSKASSVLIWVVYLTHVSSGIIALPLMLKFGIENFSFAVFVSLTYALICYFVDSVSCKYKKINISAPITIFLFITLTVYVVFLINKHFPVTSGLTYLSDVYGHRAGYKQTISEINNPVLGYLVIIAGYSLSPISIIISFYSYEKRKYMTALIFVLTAVILSLTSYSAAAFKSVAFSFIIVLLSACVMRNSKDQLLSFVKFVFFAIVTISLIGFSLESSTVYVHWFRRVFSTPGMNLAFYFDYIPFWNIDGLDRAPFIISQIYYDTDGSANAGLYGDGLAVAGIIGILRNICLFFFYSIVLDIVSEGIPLHLSGSLVIPQAYALANSGTLTVFFTYGLSINILFLYLINCYIIKNNNH